MDTLNPQERRALASEIADTLNRDDLLADEVKHMLNDNTIWRMQTTATRSFGSNNHIPRPQFDLRPQN